MTLTMQGQRFTKGWLVERKTVKKKTITQLRHCTDHESRQSIEHSYGKRLARTSLLIQEKK